MPNPPSVDPPPRTVVGPEALVALAVPARFAILDHLLTAGPRTASQCAEVVGVTPSNCSWHLRALAKVGLVEPAAQTAGDARTRPWQATAAGFDFSGASGPAAEVAQTALAGMSAHQVNELFNRYLDRQEQVPAAWRQAAAVNSYALSLTADELTSLVEAVDRLIRPYVRPLRPQAPEGSRTVNVTFRAFLNPDLDEAGS
jgi:predicted ArsR family transcriptional regulator